MGGVGAVGKLGADAGLGPFLLLAAQVSLLVPVAGPSAGHKRNAEIGRRTHCSTQLRR
jgi:hypothetical protein